MTTDQIKRNGFILGGLINITGVLLATKGFSSNAPHVLDPIVMSQFGMMMIMVWGLAYISVAKNYAAVPWLAALFCVEKAIYSAAWICWHSKNSLEAAFELDTMAGIFYSVYGINDILFTIFFAWVFITTVRK